METRLRETPATLAIYRRTQS